MTNRDTNGRFIKGNQAAKGHTEGKTGRPTKAREERFMEITLSAVTFEDWREIIQKAVWQAKRGNAQARRFLAEVLGLLTQKHEILGDHHLIVEYVNDWRNNPIAESAPGTADR